MSFITKIINKSNEEIPIEESIKTQIFILFNNKLDILWSYNAKSNELIGVHEIFQEKYLSEDFLFKLSEVLEVFDQRLYQIKCNLSYKNIIPFLNINANLSKNNQQINTISINLQEI